MLRTLVGELEQLPGVRSAALTSKLPLRGSGDNWGITVEGRPDLPDSTTSFRIVSRDYFETLGIAVRQGRGFTDGADRPGGELVIVINEAHGEEVLPGRGPDRPAAPAPGSTAGSASWAWWKTWPRRT